MRTNRNKRTTIKFPVFNDYEVRVIITNDIIATGRRLRVDLSQAEAAYVNPKGQHHGWLILKPGAHESLVAHESAHAVRALLERVGATLDDEVFAYHIGYLAGQIHDFLRGR